MIILNLLNRIFGPRESLSRDEISAYQKKRDTHDVEEKSLADDFDSDALDGWKESDIPVENMNELDNKFQSKFKTPIWSSSTLIFFILFFLASGAILTFTYTSNHTNQNQIAQIQQNEQQFDDIFTDSIDQFSSKEDQVINSLETISEEKEVKPSSLKRKTEIITNKKTDTIQSLSNLEPETTVTISPDISDNIPVKENKKTLVYNLVDEFYLHDFKLIDYRKYRDAPIKKRKLVPSGTSADQEYYESETSEDFVWKEVDIPYVDYLNESMDYFEKSNYKKALKRFNTILETYENDINAHFYGGLCYYNLGQYEKAIDHFDNSYNLEFGNFRQEAQWFKAKALVEMNEKDQAKELLNGIIYENKFYANDSKVLLKKLK
jgi:TolA-binding protein